MKKILFLLIWTVQMVSVNSFASDPAGSNAKPGVVVREDSIPNPASKDEYYIEVDNEQVKAPATNTIRNRYNSNTISLYELFSNWSDSSSQPFIRGLTKASEYASGEQKIFLDSVAASCNSANYHNQVTECVRRFMKSSHLSYLFAEDRAILKIILATCYAGSTVSSAGACFLNAFSISDISRKYAYIKQGCGDQYLCYVQFIDKITK